MPILSKTRTAPADTTTVPLPLIELLAEPRRCEGCGQPIIRTGRGKHRPSRVRTR